MSLHGSELESLWKRSILTTAAIPSLFYCFFPNELQKNSIRCQANAYHTSEKNNEACINVLHKSDVISKNLAISYLF